MSGTVSIEYRPLDVHRPFHAARSRYKCALGGYGSGKSMALCYEAIMFALEQPGSDMIIARKFAPSLKDSTEAIWLECMPDELLKAGKISRAGGHISSFQFPNGSLLKFKGIDDWKKEKSQNISWLGFDEADEQSEGNVVGMASRLRQTRPLKAAAERGYVTRMPMRRQCCLATNPAGRNWIWERFFSPLAEGKRWTNGEGFISTTLDNPHLPLDFIADQLSKGVAYVKRYVLALFDEQAGAIYPQWGAEHLIEYRPDPHGPNELWHAFDPGSTKINPSAGLWAAVDRRRQRLVVVAEYQEADLSAAEHAVNWRRIEKRLAEQGYGAVSWRTADPTAIAARDRGSNMTLADIYRREGFSFVPGPSRHAVRIPAMGELVARRALVTTKACPIFYKQVEGYRWEDQLPQHIDLGEFREQVRKGNDHTVDCGQYLSARWVLRVDKAAPEEEKTPAQHFADKVRANIRKNISAANRPALRDGVVA